ncbi:MAG: immunoglobulin domain-containing protein [Opitutaceae bacterium]|nr:immunoglobulin domain-containing protein [Opitutaceae bacterium]
MKSFRFVLPLLLLIVPAVLHAQSFYFVSKQQQFLQTSAAGAVADPLGAFKFQAKAATNVTLTLPGGSTIPFVFDTKNSDYALRQWFATKAALDAAFPNGTYRMTGASIPALSINLATDNYPVTTPQVISVTNGTWNSGGVLVVNPAQPTTINFSTFSGYATSGVAGHINFYLTSMTESGTQLETDVFSQPIFGQPATPTPLTSYTIPAGRLVSGRVYRAWLDFDTVATMDTATVAGSAVGTLFSKEVTFYIGAQNPGTSTPPPVIVSQPTSRIAVIGGSATFSVDVTIGGTPFSWQFQNNVPLGEAWSRNGQDLGDLSASGGKYTNTTTGLSLTINSLTAADAGDYTVTICTAGGVVTSAPATLTFSNSAAPVITSQPQGASVTAGQTWSLIVAASGAPAPTYQWLKDGVAVAGATSGTLSLTNITAAAAGSYTVLVSNSAGSVTSNVAVVSLTSAPPTGTAPVITTQPLGAMVTAGSTATLTVGASGSPTPTYQWRKDGVDVAGATSATLVLANITAAAAGSYTVLVSNSAGSAVSTAAVIALTSVPPPITAPPVIVVPPTNRVALTGGSVTFAVAVTVGGTSVNYQNNPNRIALAFTWRRNGQDVDLNASSGKYGNSSGDVLTINSLTAADAGDYTVTITTAGGTVTSSPATLSLSTPIAPVITSQPRGATVNAGSTLALTVTATGSPTPTYQWRKDGVTLDGATSDSLVLASAGTSAAGNYTVAVANSAGSVTSSTAAVAVTSGQPSRLPNLSVRANLGASQTLIVGFATIGAKNMLVRGIGPTLAVFGLAGVLPDPTIELYNSASTKIDENNDWSPSLASVFADVGAFALSGGSKDAALQRTCDGANTAQIRSVGTGVVLVEVYDSGGTGKLINVSARNAVGTGDNILFAGFVVDGTAAKTLLIRGVGAKLAEFGVGGVLADPKLEIYNAAGVKIAENDSWNALLQPVARSVGAFDLTLGSRDAALLLTLAPGTYTAQISGLGGGTGEALVEVYEVP